MSAELDVEKDVLRLQNENRTQCCKIKIAWTDLRGTVLKRFLPHGK